MNKRLIVVSICILLICILILCACQPKFTVIPAPADYVKPTIDKIDETYQLPNLTNDEMLPLVLNSAKQFVEWEQIEQEYASLNYNNGDVLVFTQNKTDNNNRYAIAHGITTDIELNDSNSKYYICFDAFSPAGVTVGAFVNSPYHIQYLDVLFDNITFEECNDTSFQSKLKLLSIKIENNTYDIYDDGYLIKKESSDSAVFYQSDKQVDVAYLFSMGVVYYYLERNKNLYKNTNIENTVLYTGEAPCSIELNYNGNRIIMSSKDFSSFLTNETCDTKMSINEKFVNRDDEYIEAFIKYDNSDTEISMVLFPNNNVIRYDETLLIQIDIINHLVGFECQWTQTFYDIIEYTKIKSLFNV